RESTYFHYAQYIPLMHSHSLRDALPICDRDYWEALEAGRFVDQRCGSCDAWLPGCRVLCPHCHGFDLPWEPVAAKGRVFTCTTGGGAARANCGWSWSPSSPPAPTPAYGVPQDRLPRDRARGRAARRPG